MPSAQSQAQRKSPLVLALLIITVGVGWLLGALGMGREINWIWTLGLGVLGVMTFVLSGGLDKFSVVLGPLLMASSMLSFLRQTGRLPLNTEAPLLVILLGVLLLVAQLRVVPPPMWIVLPERKNNKSA